MSLFVQESGPENAPTIVFLHSEGTSGWMWKPQIEELKEYHCLVPDLPEFGESSDIKPFTIKGATEQIIEIIRTRAHGGKAHLVGLSVGAQITLQIMSDAPKIVDHAIISGALVRPLIGGGMISIMSRLFRPLRNVRFFVGMGMISSGIPGKYYQAVRADKLAISPETMARVMKESTAFRMPTGLDKSKIPTLVAVGQYEKPEIVDSARDLVATIPNAQGGMAYRCSNTWNLQKADLFTSMVKDWISKDQLADGVMKL